MSAEGNVFHGKPCNKCHERPGVSRNGRCDECHRNEMREFRKKQKAKLAEDARTLEEILGRLKRSLGRKRKLAKGKDNGQFKRDGSDTPLPATSG